MNNKIPVAPLGTTEYETWAAANVIMQSVAPNSPLRESLNIIRYNGHHIGKMIRSIKTSWQCQVHHKNHSTVPEIVLSGKWLQHKGFNPGNKIWVLPFSEVLIVIPQCPK